jgi:uncharacterized protein YozE (UPF0346 family)
MRVFTFGELNRLRREAKRLKKEKNISHCKALDEIALAQGWANWPTLAAAAQPASDIRAKCEGSPPEQARYYVHGDQTEDEPAQYYCEFCDRLEASEHFEAVHGDAAWRRTLASLEAWRKLPLDTKYSFRRPDAAVNLFQDAYELPGASQPNARLKRTEASGLFHEWLSDQEWRPDAVGDFARLVARDATFPVSSDDIEVIRGHLRSASSEELEALEETWEDFLAAGR